MFHEALNGLLEAPGSRQVQRTVLVSEAYHDIIIIISSSSSFTHTTQQYSNVAYVGRIVQHTF